MNLLFLVLVVYHPSGTHASSGLGGGMEASPDKTTTGSPRSYLRLSSFSQTDLFYFPFIVSLQCKYKPSYEWSSKEVKFNSDKFL